MPLIRAKINRLNYDIMCHVQSIFYRFIDLLYYLTESQQLKQDLLRLTVILHVNVNIKPIKNLIKA